MLKFNEFLVYTGNFLLNETKAVMFVIKLQTIFLRTPAFVNAKQGFMMRKCFSNMGMKSSKTFSSYIFTCVKRQSLMCGFRNNFYSLTNGVKRFSLSNYTLQMARNFPKSNENTISYILYICSGVIFMVGVTYAAVPLYRIFCQATGIGGDPTLGRKLGLVQTMEPIRDRKINVSFNADHHSSMQWNFKPSQRMLTVVPGETALAFYTAKNPTKEPIVGIATYNVVPFQAGLYFNKIQCFCFEEQWLNPNEEVDMPVFFYIDPDYDDDPQLANVDDIILSYTFFKAQEGQTIPLPGFMKANSVVNLNKVKEETT